MLSVVFSRFYLARRIECTPTARNCGTTAYGEASGGMALMCDVIFAVLIYFGGVFWPGLIG